MSLGKRLKEAVRDFGLGAEVRSFSQSEVDHTVEAIKQAFIDEGWWEGKPTGTVLVKKDFYEQLMTGPEWLARFEKELNKVRVYGDQIEDLMVDRPEAVKAARRAAGAKHD